MSIEGRIHRLKENLAPRTKLDPARAELMRSVGHTTLRKGERVTVSLSGEEDHKYVRTTLQEDHDVKYNGEKEYPLQKTTQVQFVPSSEEKRHLEVLEKASYNTLETQVLEAQVYHDETTDAEIDKIVEDTKEHVTLFGKNLEVGSKLMKDFIETEPDVKRNIKPNETYEVYIYANAPKKHH